MKTARTLTAVTRHRFLVALTAVVAMTSLAFGRDTKRVITDLGVKEGTVIADVGCGRGGLSFQLSKVVGAKGKVFATEISDKCLKTVAERIKKEKVTNIEVMKSDRTKTKLAPSSLDAAIVVDVLHHVRKENRFALVKDIAASLKPGGHFFIIDNKVKDKITSEHVARVDFMAMTKAAGLTLDAEFFYLKNEEFLRFRKSAK